MSECTCMGKDSMLCLCRMIDLKRKLAVAVEALNGIRYIASLSVTNGFYFKQDAVKIDEIIHKALEQIGEK